MHSPQPTQTLGQRCIQRVDAVGQAVFRASPWKLPATLALSLALPDVWLRLVIATLVMWLMVTQLPRTASSKEASGSSLPTMDQLRWPALIAFICSTAMVVAVFLAGWVGQ